jgi:hypothetical protein
MQYRYTYRGMHCSLPCQWKRVTGQGYMPAWHDANMLPQARYLHAR